MRVDVIENVLAGDASARAGAIQRRYVDAVFVDQSTNDR